MSLFSSLILGILFITMIVNIVRWRRRGKLRNPGLIAFFGILLLFTVIPRLTRPNEHPELAIDADQMTKLTFYRANSGTIVSQRLELLGQTSDETSFKQLETILEGCQRHRLNHPHYTENFILEMEYEDKVYPYALKLDSDTERGGIDLSPFEEEGKISYSLGTYRCAGLNEFLNQLTNMEIGS